MNEEMNNNEIELNNKQKNNKRILVIIIILLVLLIVGLLSYKFLVYDKKNDNKKNNNVVDNNKHNGNNNEKNVVDNDVNNKNEENKKEDNEEKLSENKKKRDIQVQNLNVEDYKIINNDLNNFDLSFLKLENGNENIVYSPLSIKNALLMLKDGTDNNSKTQIENILNSYTPNKYQNSKNMSFANALFVKNSFKDSINKTYIDELKNKYNAEVIYDSFNNPNTINNWISDKTFKLIPNMVDSVADKDFILTNALAIDMEWVNKIQCDDFKCSWYITYEHESHSQQISSLLLVGYIPLNFEGVNYKVKAVEIGASANKYDIINKLGEENIRNTVKAEYENWLAKKCTSEKEYNKETCEYYKEKYPTISDYLNEYIDEIKGNYKKISSSTDFYFYDDNDVKVFAKDLKKYNNTTLQYVGIMPKTEDLSKFVVSSNFSKINNYVNNLKSIELDSFEEGYITSIKGYIPMFNFDYELSLENDLKSLGISDIFDNTKADLSKITTSSGAYISEAVHKANIEFSNEGIKAAAATEFGGWGGTGDIFNYIYDVPVKKIDLTFNKPYIFLIRNKDRGEIWFVGTVYEPKEIDCKKDVNYEASSFECN